MSGVVVASPDGPMGAAVLVPKKKASPEDLARLRDEIAQLTEDQLEQLNGTVMGMGLAMEVRVDPVALAIIAEIARLSTEVLRAGTVSARSLMLVEKLAHVGLDVARARSMLEAMATKTLGASLGSDLIAEAARAIVRSHPSVDPELVKTLDRLPDEAVLAMMMASSNPIVAGIGMGAFHARMVELGTNLGRKIREDASSPASPASPAGEKAASVEASPVGMAPSTACDHGLKFDLVEAEKIYGSWSPKDAVPFIAGNPKTAEIRRRFPRLFGKCPKGCGYEGIAYVSMDHYRMGDW